jgi:signal transduction histidine kinase
LKVERDQAVWVLVAAVLHELNNPLHALGLLFDELAAPSDEATRADLIERARAQADRALSQLQILRSMRSIAEPRVQRVCLDRLVGALAEDVGALAKQDRVTVRFECERSVDASADPAYLRTIVENLLDNSLHSLRAGDGGSIAVLLGVEGGHAVLRVKDDGPALDPAIRETLFEPLRTTKTQGLGLGLPIARALARAMRGDLVLDDADNKTFRLELPLGDASC